MLLGNFSRRALLAGAGFSRNWDGLLASEFFGRLIGHPAIASNQTLRALLLQETNFEAALHTARTQGFSLENVQCLQKAILDVFMGHDRAVHQTGFYSIADINIYGVQRFLSRFYGHDHDTGYLFTLNQDLLLERKFFNFDSYSQKTPRPTLPGIESHRHWFSSHGGCDRSLPKPYAACCSC